MGIGRTTRRGSASLGMIVALSSLLTATATATTASATAAPTGTSTTVDGTINAAPGYASLSGETHLVIGRQSGAHSKSAEHFFATVRGLPVGSYVVGVGGDANSRPLVSCSFDVTTANASTSCLAYGSAVDEIPAPSIGRLFVTPSGSALVQIATWPMQTTSTVAELATEGHGQLVDLAGKTGINVLVWVASAPAASGQHQLLTGITVINTNATRSYDVEIRSTAGLVSCRVNLPNPGFRFCATRLVSGEPIRLPSSATVKAKPAGDRRGTNKRIKVKTVNLF